MARSIQFALLAALVALWLPCCASDEPPNYIEEIPPAPPAGISMEEYFFEVGDQFDVKFFENEEFDITLTVRPDGRVSMPLVEDILVAGMTPAALDELITELYRDRIMDPEVTIVINRFSGQRIWITGEVYQPGEIALRGRMTVMQSIFHAGGPKLSARLDHVYVFRLARDSVVDLEEGQDQVMYRVDIEAKMDGEPVADFVLQPYDMVLVPKTTITQVADFIDQYINGVIPDFLQLRVVYMVKDVNNRNN